MAYGRIYSIIERNHGSDGETTSEYWQAVDGLKPYIGYLFGVKKHYNRTRIVFECRECAGMPGNGSTRGTRYGRHAKPMSAGNTWISIDDLDEAIKQRILDDPDNAILLEHETGTDSSGPGERMRITGTNADEMAIRLERRPKTKQLVVVPNMSQINKQIHAMTRLKGKRMPEYAPLRRLFTRRGESRWPDVERAEVDRWFVLDRNRVGASQQMEFVKKALGTPDYALLEGPPGSGKTATLCELVMQLVSSGRRVMFCASTHVAVDNLLERLEPMALKGDLIPLRIGDSPKMSDSTSKFRYVEFTKTVKDDIVNRLSGLRRRSRAQDMLQDVIQQDDTLERMVRDCANLVCGTTIGILQHPDIRDGTIGRFDYLILDEASKTTFHEFLVPAMHAAKWVVAGDIRQLVPHTDQAEIAAHLEPLVDGPVGDACVDAFMARNHGRAAVVATEDEDIRKAYREQCDKLGVDMRRAGSIRPGQIIVDTPRALAGISPLGPGVTIRGCGDICAEIKRRKDGGAAAVLEGWRRTDTEGGQRATWKEEVAWRISRHTTTGARDPATERLATETEQLVPESGRDRVMSGIDSVRKFALPSILEILQQGFDTGDGSADAETNTVMRNGLPEESLRKRHVLLTYQHRMHPDIAEFSRIHMYDSRALLTPDSMESERAWEHDAYGSRAVWMDVRGKPSKGRTGTSYRNSEEAGHAIQELKRFCEYALEHRKKGAEPWTVAMLSFYTGQIAEMRTRIQQLTGQHKSHSFKYPADGNPAVSIDLRTVDSFQGHEADIVILSMVRGGSRSNPFLDNPNRINVAVTRARYQLVVIGSKRDMPRIDSPRCALATMLPDQVMVK